MILVPLLAAAAALVEPSPPGYARLQPRRLAASSFLKNGWNQFEQNYLPPYAADDDPATAWVEGADGPGAGESLTWAGPQLQKARSFKVYLRAGYQKSKALYAKNSRPRRVRLEPLLLQGEAQQAAGAPLEVELQDQLGWQEVLVPTAPRVSGLRLTVLSVYSGTVYEDTCLSDLRVYVQGDDPYRADVEAAAAESIRRFAAERRRAAQRGDRSAVAWPPSYKAQRLAQRTLKRGALRDTSAAALLGRFSGERAVASAVAPALQRALEAAKLFDQAEPAALRLQAPEGFRSAKLVLLPRGDGGAQVALSQLEELDSGLPERARLLHRKDHAAFAAGPSKKGEEVLAAWVRGDLAGYDALFRASEREVGERETTVEKRRDLILYDGDRAALLLSRWQRWEQTTLACHVLRWEDGARPLLREIVTFVVRQGDTPYDEEAAPELSAHRFSGAP